VRFVATLVALTHPFSARSEKMEMLWRWTAGDLQVTTQSIESVPLKRSGDSLKKPFHARQNSFVASNHTDDSFAKPWEVRLTPWKLRLTRSA
jgi:hypothetical protein